MAKLAVLGLLLSLPLAAAIARSAPAADHDAPAEMARPAAALEGEMSVSADLQAAESESHPGAKWASRAYPSSPRGSPPKLETMRRCDAVPKHHRFRLRGAFPMKFDFVADDQERYRFKIHVTYNALMRTYNFPKCFVGRHKGGCHYPGCIGRCGAGCGNERINRATAERCTWKDQLNELGIAFNPMNCRTRCFNHDMCSYSRECPCSVEWIPHYRRPRNQACFKVIMLAAVNYLSGGLNMDNCPKDFSGYMHWSDLVLGNDAMWFRQKMQHAAKIAWANDTNAQRLEKELPETIQLHVKNSGKAPEAKLIARRSQATLALTSEDRSFQAELMKAMKPHDELVEDMSHNNELSPGELEAKEGLVFSENEDEEESDEEAEDEEADEADEEAEEEKKPVTSLAQTTQAKPKKMDLGKAETGLAVAQAALQQGAHALSHLVNDKAQPHLKRTSSPGLDFHQIMKGSESESKSKSESESEWRRRTRKCGGKVPDLFKFRRRGSFPKRMEFIADDQERYAFKVHIKYNMKSRTYTFPPCFRRGGNRGCHYSGCMGRCGGGCGNEKPGGLMGVKSCKTGAQIQPPPVLYKSERCRTRCFNHDMCSFARACPCSIEWLILDNSGFEPPKGQKAFKPKRPRNLSCFLVAIVAAVDVLDLGIGPLFGPDFCPKEFTGYNNINHLVSSGDSVAFNKKLKQAGRIAWEKDFPDAGQPTSLLQTGEKAEFALTEDDLKFKAELMSRIENADEDDELDQEEEDEELIEEGYEPETGNAAVAAELAEEASQRGRDEKMYENDGNAEAAYMARERDGVDQDEDNSFGDMPQFQMPELTQDEVDQGMAQV